MAIRNIRVKGDEVLRKKCKPVESIGKREMIILQDMADTMYEADGVGLAAPQVSILKRVVVIDVGEGLLELVNPEIIATSGEQIDAEGCLSVPGEDGEVKRPYVVRVRAQDRHGNTFEIEGEELLARAFCHEIDHLDGILFVDKVEK